MFSGNQKISKRQLFRNSSAGFISLIALLIPLVMNRENISSIAIALIFIGIYLAGISYSIKPQNIWLKSICYIHQWVLATMLVRITGMLIQEFLLHDMALWLIVIWFYLFCYYNLYKGLECRIRVSEILFPFFLFLFILLSILALGEVEFSRCLEISFIFNGKKLKLAYQIFCWFSAIQSLWHLQGNFQNGQSYRNGIFRIWILGAAAVIFLTIFSYGIYGNQGQTGLIFPLASAMTLAHFPGNVIGRMDALFVFVWVIGLFLLVSSLLAPLMDAEPDKRKKYLFAAFLLTSFAFSLHPKCLEWGQNFIYMISMPVQILILLCSLIGRKRLSLLLTVVVIFISGCGVQELEEQSLLTSIGVDVGSEEPYLLTLGFGTTDGEGEEPVSLEVSSLDEAEQRYWEISQKQLNFNHLKNFYFSKELLGLETFHELLEELQVDGSYARGISVYVTLAEASKEAEREEQPEEGVPLHQLLNAYYNEESCEIPLITEDQRYKGSIFWQSSGKE